MEPDPDEHLDDPPANLRGTDQGAERHGRSEADALSLKNSEQMNADHRRNAPRQHQPDCCQHQQKSTPAKVIVGLRMDRFCFDIGRGRTSLRFAGHQDEVEREREQEVDDGVDRACAPPAHDLYEICTQRPADGARQPAEQGEKGDGTASVLTIETTQS